MFLTLIVDIILALVILLGSVIGYKRGFLKSVSKPLRFFLSLFTAIRFADLISRTFVEPIIKAPLTNQIKGYLIENCPNITPQSASEELPTLLKFAASVLNVDVGSLSGENTISAIVDSLASPIVHLLSVIVAFVAIYFLSKLVYTLALSIISGFFDSAVLSFPNKLLGAFFSLLMAVIIAWLLTVIFEFAVNSPVFSSAEWAKGFEGGRIYEFFNKHNPIDILLSF